MKQLKDDEEAIKNEVLSLDSEAANLKFSK